MRLEQVPKLKRSVEAKLDEILRLGFEPTALCWSIEVTPGAASLEITVQPEFEAMKDPHDPSKPITRDQLAEMVTGSTKVSGQDGLEGKIHRSEKMPLKEGEAL